MIVPRKMYRVKDYFVATVMMTSCLLWSGVDAFLLPNHQTPHLGGTVALHSLTVNSMVPPLLDPSTTSAQWLAAVVDPDFSSLTLAEGSWRQYVSLVVIAGVLIDILLGSPFANTLLKPMRGNDDDEGRKEDSSEDDTRSQRQRSRERIDSEAVAKAAIARAQGVLELRKFLDDSKTDWDRFEDMKRKIDSEMEGLDANLEERKESLAKRRGID